MVERERHALWHPYNLVRADAQDSTSLTAPGLTHLAGFLPALYGQFGREAA